MTDKEVAVEVEVNETAAETTASVKSSVEEDDIDIEGGYLNKRGNNPLHPWNKRYFTFGTDPVSLDNLRTVHKRNERRVKKVAPAAAAEPQSEVAAGKAPAKDDKDTKDTKDAKDAKDKDAKKDAPAKSVEEVYEEANKDLLVNLAHANTNGKGLLYYHKSDDELHRQNVLGIINLRDVNSVERVEKSSKSRSFVVNTKNRNYHFSAESPQKAKGWVKTIKEKADEAKKEDDPYGSPEFQDVYKKLVARQAFEHAKNSAAILADNEINSDGEPDDIEIENGTPIVKKRKSFFGFSAVATSHEKSKAEGVTTETSTEKKQELTHVQDGNVDALKTHESENAVTHSTDAPPAPAEKPKAKSGGGFKLFGKKPAKEETPAPAPVEPLTVDAAKAQALKAVDDAVEASKTKAEEAKKDTPPTPTAPEKKPGFLAGLFGKKPTPPPAPAPVPNEETIVVSSEKNVSDVVTSEGEVTATSTGGFFSRVTNGAEKHEVEVKSGEVKTEDVVTAEGSTHVQHVEGTDASVVKGEDGEQKVDLETTDETVAIEDKGDKTETDRIEDKIEAKVERKPSLLKRLSGAVRATIGGQVAEEGASAAPQVEKVEEEAATETETKTETKTETTTTTTTTENVVVETKVAETTPVVEVAA
ncbi:hypothetical protein B0O80DRAFT_490583 [Mortierella sp. GBAus27b]|nr:hypothetical protein BGX31_006019 [Mortierella sp. GBA43]KAI8347432.1 hypothetical protein B0O80DRAFT_490583 [Mortierella sp. GBAus27b]